LAADDADENDLKKRSTKQHEMALRGWSQIKTDGTDLRRKISRGWRDEEYLRGAKLTTI